MSERQPPPDRYTPNKFFLDFSVAPKDSDRPTSFTLNIPNFPTVGEHFFVSGIMGNTGESLGSKLPDMKVIQFGRLGILFRVAQILNT